MGELDLDVIPLALRTGGTVEACVLAVGLTPDRPHGQRVGGSRVWVRQREGEPWHETCCQTLCTAQRWAALADSLEEFVSVMGAP